MVPRIARMIGAALVVAVLTVSCPLWAKGGDVVTVDKKKVMKRIDEITRLVTEAKTIVGSSKKIKHKGKLKATLDDVLQELATLSAIFEASAGTPPPPPVPKKKMIKPMAPAAFDDLKGAIAKESFGDGKLGVLSMAANGAHFTVAQVSELLALFSFGKDKLEAVKLVKDAIIDKENSYKLQDAFTFDSDKKKLTKILGQ